MSKAEASVIKTAREKILLKKFEGNAFSENLLENLLMLHNARVKKYLKEKK